MMRRVFRIILLLTFISVSQVNAQTVTRDREYGINLGFSSFLGDLGGSNTAGRPFFWDIDPEVTRPAIGFIYRMELYPNLALRLNAYYSELVGADSLSQNEFRNYRNLSFKSPIVEVSATGELNMFRFTGVKRKKFTPYLYGGVGVFWFNPQAKYNGQWVELQPLGTEGQGLPEYPNKNKYSRIQIAFPIGAGFRVLVKNNIVLGFEMACRFTTTDYIDDVSGYYPNPDYFFANEDAATAAMSAYLSNPSDGTRPDLVRVEAGRGDPTNNDTYIFGGLFTLTYRWEITKKPKIGTCYFKWNKKG